MNDGNTVRKLRAIMFSDIVDYTKVMQADEAEALKLLQKHKDVITEISAKYGAKIIKHIGDEIMLESESAVMLVLCAKEVQKYFADRNATVPKTRELWVRIGIHIGDVIVKDNDIFGDGVNIASRIRPIANPGGIVITHSVLILLGNQSGIKCNFIGNKKLKNVSEKVPVYEVLTGLEAAPKLESETSFKFDRDTVMNFVLPVSITVFFVLLLFFLMSFNNMTGYEKKFLMSDISAAHAKTASINSIKNIKANYFNISSADKSESAKLIKFYRNMYSQNPDDPKAVFYMALSYLNFHSNRGELDSAYTLFKKAENLGINSVYFYISKLELLKKLNVKSLSADTADRLYKLYPENPLAVLKTAEIYKDVCRNDKKAEFLYREALNIYPDCAAAYNGLAGIEFDRYNYEKARLLSDSALAINPGSVSSVEKAVKIYFSLSDFEQAGKTINVLPDNSIQKYILNSKLSLLKNDPALSLQYISDGLAEFPGKAELIQYYNSIQKIILISDSIQKKESSVSAGKNSWTDSWDNAVKASLKEKKPLMIIALDNESVASKYMELSISQKEIIRLINETVPLRLFLHKDMQLINELGIKSVPSIMFVDENKNVIKSFENSKGYITDKDVVQSFIAESILLSKRFAAINKDTEENKFKNAKSFSQAEEFAIEFELPIMAVFSSKTSAASDKFLHQTIYHPDFMKNYNKTVLLVTDDAETSAIAKKYNVNKYPTVLFFDEDINLISEKYGTMPQKVLSGEIDKIKLYRKRKDIPKEEINWIYNIEEAQEFAKKDNKPIFVYFSSGKKNIFIPEEPVFSEYDVVKKINTSFIPLYINPELNDQFKDSGMNVLPFVAVINKSGKLIYRSALPEDEYYLISFLDHKTNFDLTVNLGTEKFHIYLKQRELINSLVNNGLQRSARNELLLSVSEYPTAAYNFIDLASLYFSSNDFLSAEYYLKFLEEKNFMVSDRFLGVLVSSFMMYDDYERLSNFIYTLLEKFKNDAPAVNLLYSALAEINMAQSNTIEAINYAEKSNSKDPKRVENITLLGQLNFRINTDLSEKYFKSALVLDPENIIANSYLYKLTSDPYYAVAAKRSYYSGNEDFIGLRFFKTSKKFTGPGLNDLKDSAYRIRLGLFPHNPDFMHDLALFIIENSGDMSEALGIVNTLLEIEPENPEYLSTASWVNYSLGDFSGADKLITKALAKIPPEDYYKHPSVFYNIGKIKSAIGDNRSAQYYFERLLNFKNSEEFDYIKLDYARRFIESIH